MKSEFFETIKVYDGKYHNLKYHQKRYEATLKKLAVENYESLASKLNAPSSNLLLRCKIIYDANGIKNVKYFEYTKKTINSLKIIYDDELDYSLKYTNRTDLDTLYNQKNGCDDILIVKNGYITDTTIANIALYRDGTWYTPKTVLLCGTTRERYLDNGTLVLKDIRVDELKSFSKVALLNAMIDFDIIQLNKGDFFVK